MEKINEIIRKIKSEEIKPHYINSTGLSCLYCLSKNLEYKELTKNPVIITYKEDKHWETVYPVVWRSQTIGFSV